MLRLLGLGVVIYLILHNVQLGFGDGVVSLRLDGSVRSVCESVLRSCEVELRLSGQ